MHAKQRVAPEQRYKRKGEIATLLLFMLGSALFLVLGWMSVTFGKVSIDQIRFVYHSSLAGADTTVMQPLLGRFALLVGLCAVFFLAVRQTRTRGLWRKLLYAGTAVYFATALFTVGDSLEVSTLAFRKESAFIGEHYVAPSQANISFPEKKRDLIIVLAESAEHTFNDRNYFKQPVMPELEDLASRHLSFRGHVQVPGTQWTIAGITSFMFGVPLRLPLFNWNDYSLFDTFLPGAQGLLEIFASEGYEIAMILGSDVAFSGKKNLLAVHAPQAEVLDINYFYSTRDDVDQNRGTGWGLADSYLFERAREYLSQRQSDKPLLLIVETVDTHAPEPFVEADDPRQFKDDRDAFAALSRNVASFVAWIEKSLPEANDTTIVVLGDHQIMAESLGPVNLGQVPREVYNLIINGAGPKPEAGVERRFASFDLCPTILESVGASVPGGRLGIGSSLYRAAPTLVELVGVDMVVTELEHHSPFYMDFYKAPDVGSSFFSARSIFSPKIP